MALYRITKAERSNPLAETPPGVFITITDDQDPSFNAVVLVPEASMTSEVATATYAYCSTGTQYAPNTDAIICL